MFPENGSKVRFAMPVRLHNKDLSYYGITDVGIVMARDGSYIYIAFQDQYGDNYILERYDTEILEVLLDV
jgi:hypothetical protein